MALEPGTRIGSYEIIATAGAGGMGEVYRATDKALGRTVAIKVLPEALAAEPGRIARFEQEAKTLAALNHANIARIYGLEKFGDRTAIVMEFVEGQTLAERIAEGPIPVNEAMGIAWQLIDALEAAHGKQIVHRDLKPTNILLKHDGTVSVLDFGIAKAFDPLPVAPGSSRPLMTTPVTQTGVILGTAAYMSPEQARSKFVDQRSDIWAFGCVLYEMLTGQSAFGGEDVPITLARVLAQDTNMESLPAMISPAVRQTLRLCLQKDPRQRVADIRDVRLAFQGAFETIVPASRETAGRSRLRLAGALAAATLLAAAAGLGAWSLKPEAPRSLTRSLITDPEAPFVPVDSDINLAMSRDGSLVAYRGLVNGEAVLFLRSLSSLKALPVDGLPSGIRNIFFSPDGNWIGFSDGTGLFRASVDGGLWIPITDAVGGGSRGATWGPDDTIVFASFTATGLFRVPVGGGEPESVTTADVASGEFHWWPQFLPGGDAVLFTIVSTSDENDAGQIAVVRLGDPEPKRLMLVGSSPRYVDTGYIVYAVGNTLQAVGFDPDRLEVTTAPFPIVDEVHINSELASSFAVSGDGMLVYATGDVTVGANQLVFIHRDGREEQLPFVPNSYTWPRLSSDGNRVAESIASEDIWVGDIRRANWNPVTRDPGIDNVPLWTPDDQSIVFATQRATPGTFSFFQKRADGTGDAVEILKAEHLGGNFKPYDWTPDGTQMLFDYGPAATLDIGIMTVGGDQDWRPLIAGDALEAAPSLSRDGNWIAYASNRSGRCEIYTERFPALTDRTPISSGGGAEALWSPTSDELYYRLGDKLLVVAFNPGDGLDPGTPQVVAEGLPVPTCGRRTYDVSADGERFIFAKPVALVEDSESETELILVQHLFDDIERRMPAR